MARTRGSKAAAEQDAASTSSSDHEEVMQDGGESEGESSNDDDGQQQQQQVNDDDDDSQDDESNEEEESDGSEEEEEDTEQPAAANTEDDTPSNNNNESCTFALADLVSFNTHQINPAQLYSGVNHSSATTSYYTDNNNCCIESSLPINEDVLLNKAIGGTKQLLKELWKCDSERVEGGFVMAKLPSRGKSDGYVLPRSLPPPPQKQLTKWEKFALERGISPKSKRSRKQFDEATGTWKHLTGSLQNKANAGPESWPILEVKKNDDPLQDPWEKLREEKKNRVGKNTVNRMKNAEQAGLLEKGSANRQLKQMKKMEKQRVLSREQERKQGIIAPVGVPVDMASKDGKRGKPSITLALQATQVSTASLGKFDKMREGEPERNLEKQQRLKKRKAATLLDKSVEQQKSRSILDKVMNGSKEKEKDVRKGKYAKGETAYDYEFDDGLGAGSFRKKKGRAGVGKMRKITKKRIK